MISARTFARHTAVWADVAPLLEHLVRWSNLNETKFGPRVSGAGHVSHPALVAEVGFGLAMRASQGDTVVESDIERSVIHEQARLPGSDAGTRGLTIDEWRQARSVAENIVAFFDGKNAEYLPLVPGCGVVDEARADAAADDLLVEIKCVTRGFRGSDFRQLLTYSAMYHAAGHSFDRIALVNPRTGYLCEMSMGFVADSVAGVPAVVLLDEIVAWMAGLQVSA